METEITVRLRVAPQHTTETETLPFSEAELIHAIVRDVPWVTSAVVLRNNGFGHLLPDEDTRQEL